MHVLEGLVGLSLTHRQGTPPDKVLLDGVSNVPVIGNDQEERKDRVGGHEEEAIIDEALEVQREAFICRFFFFDQIERDNVCH